MSLLLTLALAANLKAGGFVPVGDEHEVRVYRRDAGPAIELAAEGVIRAPPDVVLKVLTDYQGHPRWQKTLKESRVLRRGDAFVEVYQHLDLPMLSDRDFTLHVTWGRNGESTWVRFTAANDRGPPPREGVVRVAVHEGAWELRPIEGGSATFAQYRFRLDLAGSFPSWMGKGRAAKDVPNLFEGIRRQVQNYR